jgi:hypothetical protein
VRAAVAAGVRVELVATLAGSRYLERRAEALAQDGPVLPALSRHPRRQGALDDQQNRYAARRRARAA